MKTDLHVHTIIPNLKF